MIYLPMFFAFVFLIIGVTGAILGADGTSKLIHQLRNWKPEDACRGMTIIQYKGYYFGKAKIREFKVRDGQLKSYDASVKYIIIDRRDGEVIVRNSIEDLMWYLENGNSLYVQDVSELQKCLISYQQKLHEEAAVQLSHWNNGIKNIIDVGKPITVNSKQLVIDQLLEGTESEEELRLLNRILERQIKNQ